MPSNLKFIFLGFSSLFIDFFRYSIYQVNGYLLDTGVFILVYFAFFAKYLKLINVRFFIISIVLCAHFLVFKLNSDFSADYIDMLTFYCFIYTLFLIKKENVVKIISSVNGKLFVTVTSVFTTVYFLTALLARPIAGEDLIETGYVVGFIWPHGYGYWISVLCLIISVTYRKKIIPLLFLITSFIVGARIAFLTGFISFIYILYKKYYVSFLKSLSYSLLLVLLIIASLPFIQDSTTFIRMANDLENIAYDNSGLFDLESPVLNMFTSGRSYMWSQMYDSYTSMNDKAIYFFGFNPQEIKNINYISVRNTIWMHNDWFQALYGYGVVGFLLYLTGFLVFWKESSFNIVIFAIFILSSFLNGLYPYHGFSLLFLMMCWVVLLKSKKIKIQKQIQKQI